MSINSKTVKRLKLIAKIFVAVLAVVVLLCVIPIPFGINKTMTGQYWESENSDFLESSEIGINGTYYVYILPFINDNSFSGSITISNFEFTAKSNLFPVTFSPSHVNGINIIGGLIYYVPSYGRFEHVGEIAMKDLFSEVVILLPSDSPDAVTKIISAPAANRQEAVDLAKAVFSDLFGFK